MIAPMSNKSRIARWRTTHPEFAEALRFRDEDGIFQNDAVKRALFHRANGYSTRKFSLTVIEREAAERARGGRAQKGTGS
jgi:hypothetical protein